MNSVSSRTHHFFPFFLTILIIVAIPATVQSAAEKAIGDRILVDTNASGPRVQRAFGKWHVSWLDSDPTNYVWLRQYNNAGIPGVEATSSDPVGSPKDPTIATSQDHVLLVYAVENSAAHQFHLVAVLFDDNGTQLDQEYVVSHTGLPNTSFHNPAVANKPGTNEFMVIYREEEIVASGTFGLAINTNSGQIVVTGGPVEYWGTGGGEPDIAYGRYGVGGGFFIERYFAVFKASPGGAEIFGQSIVPGTATASGGNVGFPINGVTGDPAIASWEGSGETPAIVTWRRGSPETVVAQRIRFNGSLQGGLITVASDAEMPNIAASETEFLIVFDESTLPVHQDRIQGRYYDLNGNPLGSAFMIVDDTETTSYPAVASDGVNYLVAYQTSPSVGQLDVAIQRVGLGAFSFVETEVSDNGTESRGVAWGDWDTFPTDLPDLFIGNAGPEINLVFENEGAGVFDRQLNCGADQTIGGQGAAWADYDNDGKLDVYVSNGSGPNELYHYDFDGFHTFQVAGNDQGVDDAGDGRSVAWGDYDADGLLDLYVGNRYTANRLYHNDGGSFSEVGGFLGVGDTGNSEAVAFVDFDDDGDVDIYVGNAGSANHLYLNTGGTFTEVAAAWNLDDAGSARSVSWCDYDNDGDSDLYISKYNQPDSFYRNNGTTFQLMGSIGLNDSGRGESACWADFDLDGDQDLFLANFTGADRFFRNSGVSFAEIGTLVGLDDEGGSLGAAWADIDEDGDPDLCVTNFGGQNRIFINDFDTGNNWLKVNLEGVDANVSAIGARVRVVAGALAQTQDVGGRNGYLSQNELTLIFGLGGETMVDSVIVRWPGGGMDIFADISPNQIVHISEGSGVSVVGDLPLPRFRILGNKPNPFNPGTEIMFELSATETIELTILDVRGYQIAILAGGVWQEGRHSVVWKGTDGAGRQVAAGVYFARLSSADRQAVRPMVLVK